MEKGYSVTVVVCGVLLFLHFTTAVGHFSGVSASSAAMLQYNMLQYNMLQYNMLQYNMLQYNMLQYNMLQYNMLQYTMAALLALQLLPDPLP